VHCPNCRVLKEEPNARQPRVRTDEVGGKRRAVSRVVEEGTRLKRGKKREEDSKREGVNFAPCRKKPSKGGGLDISLKEEGKER